ncbi:MAG: cytochrome c biogenesis protein CcdA [bacterium]|nr:cytochrome c biogenesis protein CcdA [bacterium]
MEQSSKFKTTLAILLLGLFAVIVFGLIWFFFLGPETPVGFGWYFFSFAAGLTMIVLPCTLPLAFVIVPLSMGKGAAKGLGIALAFGLGVALMLSVYGVVAAIIGEVAIGTLGAPLEVVKNWLYFVAGAFAFLFALGELGLVRFRMPTYSGAAPALIQKQQDFIKAFLLGLFLGNVGVGCPHPATPVILTRIAVSGDIFYGWLLFFTHAVGRVLPLLLLAVLGILGVNALSWLIARKDKVERATGWGMVFVAGFILVLGLFSHDWWVYSGQHTLLEEITGEEKFLGIIINRFNLAGVPHTHGVPVGSGLFGLPLWLGNWVLVTLWVIPLWWYYQTLKKKNKKLKTAGETEITKTEDRLMPLRFWFFAALTLLLAQTFIYVLPTRFLIQAGAIGGGNMMEDVHGEDADMHDDVAMMQNGHEDDEHSALQYHEEADVTEGVAVNLNITPVPLRAEQAQRLDFFVNEKPSRTPVPAETLQIDNTKLMHVIGLRSDMNEFFHIHPSVTDTPGILSVPYTFAKPGMYKVWSEIKKDGVGHVFGHPAVSVEGDGAEEEKFVSFVRTAFVDDYQVLLKMSDPVVKNHEHELQFDIHTVAGEEVAVEPYLGTDMHLTLIKDDWTQFIHTHPVRSSAMGLSFGSQKGEADLRLSPSSNGILSQTSNGAHPEGDSHAAAERAPQFALVERALAHGGIEDEHEEMADGSDEVINFHAVFPEAGLYKAFAQFRPRGTTLSADEALTVSFWIQVEEKEPFGASRWWALLLVSLAAMTVLGLGVRKFLSVKT